MRRFFNILVFFLFASFLYSCGDVNPVWETYTSAEGGFKITMPTNTKKTERKVTTPFGKQFIHYITWKPNSLTIDKFKLFQVSYTDCPSRFSSDSVMLHRVMDSSINMRVKDFAEIELEPHTISLNGYPGRAFIFDLPENNTIAIVKQCVVNGKLYDLTVVLKRNYATNAEVHTFFNSFQVLR